MKKTRIPARDSYRIDHAKYGAYFYNVVFATHAEAQAHIDERNPTYRDKLTIVKFHEPEHDEYHLGTLRLGALK